MMIRKLANMDIRIDLIFCGESHKGISVLHSPSTCLSAVQYLFGGLAKPRAIIPKKEITAEIQ